jgi:NAD-dependent dihydropyrimidine dehydrogenase PreA subunit
MTAESDAYRKLQEHLDEMPLGYPATKSGVEINLLKTIFTPHEAIAATHLDYKHKTIDQIFESARGDIGTKEELASILDAIVAKGGISRRQREGQKQYAVVPLVLWGMYEQQLKRLSPEFLMHFGEYMQTEFSFELATATIPMMRVIPVEESIEVEHAVATYDELRCLIEQAGDRITVQECFCKKVNDLQGKNCQTTDRRDMCMSMGDLADLYSEEGWGRRITQEEALEIARQNEEEGLVLMPGNAVNAAFMCACCRDCCSMLTMMKFAPRPADVVASNYFAQVNADLCKGHGICVARCPMDAVTIDDMVASVDLAKCIGCGLCIPTCPDNAMLLVKKDEETVPPQTEEDRFDAMMEHKSSLTGKVRDAALKTIMKAATRLSR